jgi:hypothetical protein
MADECSYPHDDGNLLTPTSGCLRRVGQRPERVLASLAIASALLHLAMTGSMIGHGGLIPSAMLAIMALACFRCGIRIWDNPSQRSWTVLGVMNAGMLAMHLWLLLPNGYGGAPRLGDVADGAAHFGHRGSGMVDLPLDHAALMWSLAVLSAVELTGALIMMKLRAYKTASGLQRRGDNHSISTSSKGHDHDSNDFTHV